MLNRLGCLIILLMPCASYGAEATVEACASATVSDETNSGVINWSSGVAGFNEECITLNLKAELEGSQVSVKDSDSLAIGFMWGGCNTSNTDAGFKLTIEWNYSIATSGDYDEDRATAKVAFTLADEDYTEGSGSGSHEFTSSIPAGVCVDSIPYELSASAEAFTTYSTWRLSNDAGINGVFYDTGNPGHGFDFNVHDQGLTIFYYGHTANGERLWLISETLSQNLEYHQDYSLQMFEVAEGGFGAPVSNEKSWGALAIYLEDCDTAYATLDGVDGKFDVTLSRIAGLSGVECY